MPFAPFRPVPLKFKKKHCVSRLPALNSGFVRTSVEGRSAVYPPLRLVGADPRRSLSGTQNQNLGEGGSFPHAVSLNISPPLGIF